MIPALIQASRRDREVDHVISVINLVFLSIPDFLLGTLLLVTFCVAIPILPAVSLVDESSSAMQYLRAMTLPAITLAIAMAIAAVRMLRDNLIEVLDSDYVRMAELKGLPPRAVLLRHALPNALVPTLNVTAINLGYLIGGVVIVEKVFSYPGFRRAPGRFAAISRHSADRSDGHHRGSGLCRGQSPCRSGQPFC